MCLTSTHNLPSSEANTRERGVCWGHPRPRQEASPPAPLIRETSNIALTGHINGLLRFLQEWWVDREAHLRDVLPACVRKRDALLPLLYHERDSQCLIA